MTEARVDGFRDDTCPTSDPAFMSEFAERTLAQHTLIYVWCMLGLESCSAQSLPLR